MGREGGDEGWGGKEGGDEGWGGREGMKGGEGGMKRGCKSSLFHTARPSRLKDIQDCDRIA